jgi:hypothetical protein
MSRIAASLAIAAFLAAIALRTWTTVLGFPALAVDAVVFQPQAISFARDGSLVNPVWRPAKNLDPEGVGRMSYHGFLSPMVTGSLMNRADAFALTRSLAAIHALSALLFPLFLYRFARLWKIPMNAGVVCWATLLAWVNAHYTLSNVGRYESMAALVLMAGILAGSFFSATWQTRVGGALAGILAAMHPIAGCLAAIGICVRATWKFPVAQCARHIVVAGGYAMAVFTLLLLWYPYGFEDWLYGTLSMGRHAMAPVHAPLVARLRYWLWHGPSFFSLGVAVLFAFGGWRFLRRRQLEGRGPAAPILFYPGIAVALAAIWRFAVQAPWSNYNLMPFVPLGLLLIFKETAPGLEPRSRLPQRMLAGAAVAVLLIAAIGPARDTLMRIHFLRHGVTLAEARRELARFREQHPGAEIALDTNLFTLTEDYRNVIFWSGKAPLGIAYLVVAEAYRQRPAPPAIEGYELTENHFNPRPPRLLGFALAEDNKGNGFAIYRTVPTLGQTAGIGTQQVGSITFPSRLHSPHHLFRLTQKIAAPSPSEACRFSSTSSSQSGRYHAPFPQRGQASAFTSSPAGRNSTQPCRFGRPPWQLTTVELKSGESQAGFITGRLPDAEASKITTSPDSVMPEAMLQGFTAQKAADLLAYLVSLK